MNKSEKFWNMLSRNYDKPDSIHKVFEYESIGYINKHLKKSDVVLDFGCATGTIASSLADKVKEMHGIDISPKMIQIAKERANDRKIQNLYFSDSSIFDDKYNKNSFNMVLAFSVLHLLEESETIIQRIHELLIPGGLFISLTPCLGEKAGLRTFLSLLNKIRMIPNISCFRIFELENLMTQASLHVIYSKSIANNPMEHFIIAEK